jgi:hypothetical protein
MSDPNNIDEINSAIHLALARKLLDRIQSGEVSAADLSVARQYLKDNNVDATREQNPHMIPLAHELPDNDDFAN